MSLAGVGLIKWTVKIPRDVELPSVLRGAPWYLTDEESFELVGYLLEQLRTRRAVELPVGPGWPDWDQVAQWPPQSFSAGPPKGRTGVVQWGGPQSAVVRHFLSRLLDGIGPDGRTQAAQELMTAVWHALRERDRQHPAQEQLLVAGHGKLNGTFRVNPRWLRIKLALGTELWECDRCASLSAYNVRGICPRNGCPGALGQVDEGRAAQNHYRLLYESPDLPAAMVAEEHTAQIESKEARRRQDEFKQGLTHSQRLKRRYARTSRAWRNSGRSCSGSGRALGASRRGCGRCPTLGGPTYRLSIVEVAGAPGQQEDLLVGRGGPVLDAFRHRVGVRPDDLRAHPPALRLQSEGDPRRHHHEILRFQARLRHAVGLAQGPVPHRRSPCAPTPGCSPTRPAPVA